MAWSVAFGLGCLVGTGGLAAAVFDFSAPLENPEMNYSGGVMSYRVFDPAQNQWLSDFAASGVPGGSSTNHGVVAWSSGSTVFLRVYDPGRTNWMGTNVVSGSTLDLRNSRGVAAWSTGAAVHFQVYEPGPGRWIGAAQSSGSTFNLRNEQGTISWSSGNAVFFYAYDPARREWRGDGLLSGNTFDLSNQDGVVAWSSGGVISYAVYDPNRGSGSDRGRWVRQSDALGTTVTLRNEGGVVAWSSGNTVFCRVYDPRSQQWVAHSASLASPPSNLAITNGVVSWSVVGGTMVRAYNPLSAQWTNAPTPPLAYFMAAPASGAAPLRTRFVDLSVGGTSWLWDFGDGQGSVRRAPAHRYAGLGRFEPRLVLSNPAGIAQFSTNVLTDIEAPVGSIVINEGAALTTNRTVRLTLSATDNSGTVAAMRLRNETLAWGEWQAFAIEREWLLSEGNGTKTVQAQFRDPSLNESAIVSDTITLDTTPLPEVTFAFTSTNVFENVGGIDIPIRLSHPFTRRVTVQCTTSGGTAVPGQHYLPLDERIEFNTGFTTRTVRLTILDNLITEPNRTIELSLTAVTSAIVGGPLVVTVLDDDPAGVRFESATYTVNEGAGNASIPVILESPAGLAVSVGYFATNGTAQPGIDYLPVSGRLNFAPGQTRATFTVPIIDNDLDQLTRTVSLRLAAPTNAVLRPPSEATLSILDNDPPTANLTQVEYRFTGSAGSAEIGVRLSKPGTETILIDYATVDGGTAVSGVDYVGVRDTLIFTPGQTERSFLVPVLANPERTQPRTVWLRLNAALNARLGPTTTGILRIGSGARPRLHEPQVLADGRFRMTIASDPGTRVEVQGRDHGANWRVLNTLDNPTGNVVFTDAATAGIASRWYRVRLLE